MPGKYSSTISASPKNSQPSKVLINRLGLFLIKYFFHQKRKHLNNRDA
jgi:hypothetical protein